MKTFLPLEQAQQIDTTYEREWKTVTIAGEQAELLQRMQRVVFRGRRLELTKPGMAFGTLATTPGSIVLVNQERPTGEQLSQTGWEVKGGYGVQDQTGSQTADAEAEQETGRAVTTSSPLAMLRADHANELHPITVNTVSLGEEDSAKEVEFNPSERHGMEWIRESRAFTPEQVRQLYLDGQLTDARTLGVLMAQELKDRTLDWQAGLEALEAQVRIGDIQNTTRASLLSIAKMKSETEIGYDDLLVSNPDRTEYLLVRTAQSRVEFLLPKKTSVILTPSHSTPAINTMNIEDALATIEDVALNHISTRELETEDHCYDMAESYLQHSLVTNPANEQYGVRIGIVNVDDDLDDDWVDANMLAQLVQKGQVSLLTLAAIKAYLLETGSKF